MIKPDFTDSELIVLTAILKGKRLTLKSQEVVVASKLVVIHEHTEEEEEVPLDEILDLDVYLSTKDIQIIELSTRVKELTEKLKVTDEKRLKERKGNIKATREMHEAIDGRKPKIKSTRAIHLKKLEIQEIEKLLTKGNSPKTIANAYNASITVIYTIKAGTHHLSTKDFKVIK